MCDKQRLFILFFVWFFLPESLQLFYDNYFVCLWAFTMKKASFIACRFFFIKFAFDISLTGKTLSKT